MLLDEPGLRIGGRVRVADGRKGRPLIVAVHGGGFTSSYFDIPGFSLMDRAAERGVSVLSLDRGGYGESSPPPGGEQTLAGSAAWVNQAIARLWPRFAADHAGVVLVGHSIGGATVIEVAANSAGWPLKGVAMSGVALGPPPAAGEYWKRFPTDPWWDAPRELKAQLMFGPEQFVPPGVKDAVAAASVPVSTLELREINTVWHDTVEPLSAAVTVPVHYRLGQHEALWDASEQQVAAFAANFARAPFVDAALALDAGHCIDFHYVGAAFQFDQIAFAARCVSEQLC